MHRRIATIVLALMLLALQTQVQVAEAEIEQLSLRNARLAAEVQDLETGSQAIEGRARNSLGMIARGETFYLVVAPGAE